MITCRNCMNPLLLNTHTQGQQSNHSRYQHMYCALCLTNKQFLHYSQFQRQWQNRRLPQRVKSSVLVHWLYICQKKSVCKAFQHHRTFHLMPVGTQHWQENKQQKSFHKCLRKTYKKLSTIIFTIFHEFKSSSVT